VTVGALTEDTGTGTNSVWIISLTSISAEGDITVEIADFGRFDVLSPAQTVDVYKNAVVPVKLYYITASSDPNSVISPSGINTVSKGGSITFAFTAKDGYHISSVTVDGRPLSGDQIKRGNFTFSDVNSNHSINAISAAGPGPDKNNGGGDGDGTGDGDGKGDGDGETGGGTPWALIAAVVVILIIICLAAAFVWMKKSK